MAHTENTTRYSQSLIDSGSLSFHHFLITPLDPKLCKIFTINTPKKKKKGRSPGENSKYAKPSIIEKLWNVCCGCSQNFMCAQKHALQHIHMSQCPILSPKFEYQTKRKTRKLTARFSLKKNIYFH